MRHPADLRLDDVARGHAARTPSVVATRCGDGEWTWRELADRVDGLAGLLLSLGIQPGDRVAWLAQNCHRYLEALLACSRLGAVFAPLNWRQSVAELESVLADLDPALVLYQQEELGRVVTDVRASASPAWRWLRIDARPDDPSGYDARLGDAVGCEGDTDHGAGGPVLLLYTAAFDGRPAGALLTDRSLLIQAAYGIQFGGVAPTDVYLNTGPLFHVGTLKTTLATLLAGGINVFVRRVDPEELCRTVDRHRCTGAFLQPPTMAAMVEANRDGRYDLRSLRAKHGPPGWDEMVSPLESRYRSGFGQTELGGVVTFVDRDRPSMGTAGWPAPLCEVVALAPDGAPVAGEVGELAVRGPVVMAGYHRRPDLTEARHRGGWHRTGDLGRIEADGSVTFVGPATRLIKSAAENIYPAEVEACLASHPDVADVAVLGVPDATWGQSVTAVVVPRDGVTVDPDDLIAHCRARIASYKKPRQVRFAPSLPRRAGQLDRDALDRDYGGGGYPTSG